MNALQRILAATDFSPAGHSAVARAAQLADQHGAQLILVHATPDWTASSQYAVMRHAQYHRITQRAEELMWEEISGIQNQHPRVSVRGEIQRDRATLAISRMIESVSADLLVIGAGGEQLLLNAMPILGGTALKLIARASVPLLVVRTADHGAYRSALAAVPMDLQAALKVLNWALTLAGSGTCHLVRPYEAPYANRQLSVLSEDEIAAAAETQRLLAVQDCSILMRSARPDQRVQTHLICGAPMSAVLEQVTQLSPQLVVVGLHPHPPAQHPTDWTASLGTRIAYHCTKDVLAVP